MTPARSIDEALARVEAEDTGYVMPRGAALMPVVAP
jgi:hypothetical protein